MPNAHATAVSIMEQSFVQFGVTLTAVILVSTLALLYFRKVRQERPPVGTFNGRDIGILLALIIALPFLYAVMPGWLLTCFLAFTFAASVSIGYRQVWRAGPVWLVIGLLIGANLWTSANLMGTTVGWQLWWAELDILVLLGAVAVSNLYVQGGMKLKHVAWFGLTLAVYDVCSTLVINVTAVLVEEFIGHPLDPTFGMRFGLNNYGIGIGDLLFYALFVVASYKAYGWAAARLAIAAMILFGAAAPSLFPIFLPLIDFRNDVLIPSQLFFATAAFLCYLWMKRRYGRERTMAEYRAAADGAGPAAVSAQPVTAPEPASV